MEATKHINYESDFSVLICLKGGRPTYPWTLVFTTNPRFSGSRYVVSFDGVNYTNCQPLEGTSDFVRVEFNSHGLGAGMLTYKFYEATPDAAFSDGKRNTVRPVELPIQLWDAPSDDAALPPEIIVILQSLIKGLSAYEVEVKNGFVGTEAEWLKSLHADADKVAADLLLETKTRVAADQELAAAAEQKMNTKDTATLTAAKEFATAADTTTIRDAKAFTTSEIAKIPTPDVSGQIASHNSATTSHTDIRESVARKVEKEAGKGLSAQDFTALLKTKLEGLNNYDDATIRAAVASVQTQLNTLLNGNVNGVIDAFNEIEKFLAGITDAQTLTGLLADLRREVVALIPTKTSQLTNDAGFLTSEVDPTVPAWAKNPTKPIYTASEVGAEPVQVVETIATATATLNVVGGHTYLCGVMTSLTLATVENAPREAVIRFASGAAATTLSLPATLKVVGYAKPAANQSYEISIRQGAAVIVNF